MEDLLKYIEKRLKDIEVSLDDLTLDDVDHAFASGQRDELEQIKKRITGSL